LSTDSTKVERWATGLNNYWPTIQTGLTELPAEVNAVAKRINEACQCEDEIINDHVDMLIELLQGYKVEFNEKKFSFSIKMISVFVRIYVNVLKIHYKSNKKLFNELRIKIDVH